MLRRGVAGFVLLAALLPICAKAALPSGQTYDTFLKFYRDDIQFINQNAGRHLIPLSIAARGGDAEDGRMVYELMGDTLGVYIQTDGTSQVIETAVISITAPAGIAYGNALFHDFAISGYQSYALLMAMHAAENSVDRFALVSDVEAGLAEADTYTRQVGVYTLNCVREDKTVIFSFVNSRLAALEEHDADTGGEKMEGYEGDGLL